MLLDLVTPQSLLLFDIDGTLLDTGGAGRRAMERAFFSVTGRKDACAFKFDGMTDLSIARKGLEAIGHEVERSAVDALLDAYLQALAEEVPRSSGYTLHVGVAQTIERAVRTAGLVVGLGTGNLRRGAQIKLDRAGIFEHFRFGGFGCDHEDRAELLRIGAERGAELAGRPLRECKVVIIGDTPKDVAAALAIGASCVAVATGRYGVDELRDAGATVTVRNLLEEEAVGEMFG